MRILLAQDTFLPKLGGAEIHVWKLAQMLARRGHDVTILTTVGGAPVVDGLKVHRFPLLQSQGKKALAALPLYLPYLMRLVSDHDIVHGHYTAFCSAVLGTLARLFKRPFLVTL